MQWVASSTLSLSTKVGVAVKSVAAQALGTWLESREDDPYPEERPDVDTTVCRCLACVMVQKRQLNVCIYLHKAMSW